PEVGNNRALSTGLIEEDQSSQPHQNKVGQHLGELDNVRVNWVRVLALFELLVLLDDADRVGVGDLQLQGDVEQQLFQRHAGLLDRQEIESQGIDGIVKELACVECPVPLTHPHSRQQLGEFAVMFGSLIVGTAAGIARQQREHGPVVLRKIKHQP